MFWEGHIGLESPKTTKRDAEGFDEEMYGQGVCPLPSQLRGLGEHHKLPPARSGAEPQPLIIFGHYIRALILFIQTLAVYKSFTYLLTYTQFCAISCMF